VLLVDVDPQANATSGLGIAAEGRPTTAEVRLDELPVDEAVVTTGVANLDLVPSSPDLARAAVELPGRAGRERLLASALAPARERYGYVFLDCPPSLDLLTVNALAAADRLIVPVQCEYYALEGLAQLLHSTELVRARLNPRLTIAGMLLTMVDGRTRLAADVADQVRRAFGDLVFQAVVPRSVRLAEAPSHGLPITAYDRSSPGADAYYRVAGELVERR
jgi:chromosome partitioning protein